MALGLQIQPELEEIPKPETGTQADIAVEKTVRRAGDTSQTLDCSAVVKHRETLGTV